MEGLRPFADGWVNIKAAADRGESILDAMGGIVPSSLYGQAADIINEMEGKG